MVVEKKEKRKQGIVRGNELMNWKKKRKLFDACFVIESLDFTCINLKQRGVRKISRRRWKVGKRERDFTLPIYK